LSYTKYIDFWKKIEKLVLLLEKNLRKRSNLIRDQPLLLL
jgi:hypothetical protein